MLLLLRAMVAVAGVVEEGRGQEGVDNAILLVLILLVLVLELVVMILVPVAREEVSIVMGKRPHHPSMHARGAGNFTAARVYPIGTRYHTSLRATLPKDPGHTGRPCQPQP